MASSPQKRTASVLLALVAFAVLARVGYLALWPVSTPAAFAGSLSVDAAIERSAAEGKPVVAVATAGFCGACKSYQRGALADGKVESWLNEHAVTALIDLDRDPDAAKRFGIFGIPLTLIIVDGHVVARRTGGARADELLAWLEEHAGEAGAPD